MRMIDVNVREQPSKLNPKVLETWLNNTIQDAQHLDIPGILLKPDNLKPIERYQIDRSTLTVSLSQFYNFIEQRYEP